MTRRPERHWLPLAASVAVLLVVGGVLAGTRPWSGSTGADRTPVPALPGPGVAPSASPGPAGSGGVVVPWADLRPSERDVPAPAIITPSVPPITPCRADQVTVDGSFAKDAMRVEVALRDGVTSCHLPGAPSAVDLIGSGSVQARDAAAAVSPNPPFLYFAARTLTREAPKVELEVRLPGGWCAGEAAPTAVVYLAPKGSRVNDVTVAPLRADVSGVKPSCTDQRAAPEYLPFTTPGVDAAMPPASWSHLEASADVLPPVVLGSDWTFTVRLTNSGSQPVPLMPCPAYNLALSADPSGNGHATVSTSGLLNCAAARPSIGPGDSVTFDMRVAGDLTPRADFSPGKPLGVQWAIAGVPTTGFGVQTR